MHQDGEGFNIVLQALPLNGKIVLRPLKADKGETTEAAQAAIRGANDSRKAGRK